MDAGPHVDPSTNPDEYSGPHLDSYTLPNCNTDTHSDETSRTTKNCIPDEHVLAWLNKGSSFSCAGHSY